MGMNQPSPEILQQLMTQQQSQGTDPSQEQAATGGYPMAGIQFPPVLNNPPQVDPMELLPEVIAQYMNNALGVIGDATLDKPVQSKILLEQAQAISSLVSSLQGKEQSQTDPAQQQAEMVMKQQAHEQDLQMKHEAHQTMIQQQVEKHQMEMQQMAHDMELGKMKMMNDQMMNEQKLKHQEENHQQQLVHNEKAAQAKAQQAEQTSQSKQSSKQGNDNAK